MSEKKEKNFAIILASGSGKRFMSDKPKQFTQICGKTILERTVEAFNMSCAIDEIIIATNPEYKDLVSEIIKNNSYNKVTKIVSGGETRKDSSFNAVNAINDTTGKVLIHDCARPFVSQKIITECIKALDKYPAITTAVPVTDTIVEISDSKIKEIPKRQNLMRVQTPQGFKLSLIKEAHRLSSGDNNFTDDCGMIIKHKLAEVHIVAGDSNNIKITYPEDIYTAERIMNN